jgi:hypothetical protein
LCGDVWENGGQWLPGSPSYHLLPNPEMAELRRSSAVGRPILAIFAASACHKIIALKSSPGEPPATVDAWRAVGCNKNRVDTLSNVAASSRYSTTCAARFASPNDLSAADLNRFQQQRAEKRPARRHQIVPENSVVNTQLKRY